MSEWKKVSDDLSVAGQVTPEQFSELADEGFKSVLNLRSADETGFLSDEKEKAQAAGLEYANIPLKPTEPSQQLTAEAIQEIENLPKPILIHCAGGARAGGIALIANAIQSGLNFEEIQAKAESLGINLDQPHLKQFLQEKYSQTKTTV